MNRIKKNLSVLLLLLAVMGMMMPAWAAPLDLNQEEIIVQLARKYYFRHHGILTEHAIFASGDQPGTVTVTFASGDEGNLNVKDCYQLNRQTLQGQNAFGEKINLLEERGEYSDVRLEHLARDYYRLKKGRTPDVVRITEKPDEDTVVILVAAQDGTSRQLTVLEQYTLDRRTVIGTDLHERTVNLLAYSDTFLK